MEKSTQKLIWLAIFAFCMANVESAVVVYLRFLYYPGGFAFPIVQTPITTTLVELGREAATILMLYAVARLTYKKALHRFCAFIYLFGVWDIFYYVWLRVFLGWPESLLTWDILYLLPLPWIGPVLAPVLVSVAMITAAVIIIRLEERGIHFYNPLLLWLITIFAGLVIFFSFIIDFRVVTGGTMPVSFKWGIFLVGLGIGAGVFVGALIKTIKNN